MNKGKFLNEKIKEINDINNAIEFAFSFQYLAFYTEALPYIQDF